MSAITWACLAVSVWQSLCISYSLCHIYIALAWLLIGQTQISCRELLVDKPLQGHIKLCSVVYVVHVASTCVWLARHVKEDISEVPFLHVSTFRPVVLNQCGTALCWIASPVSCVQLQSQGPTLLCLCSIALLQKCRSAARVQSSGLSLSACMTT